MKIQLSSITKTNFAFPSEWSAITEKNEEVTISYRYGVINILKEGKIKLKTDKDEFDLGGYMEDEELKEILIRDELAVD